MLSSWPQANEACGWEECCHWCRAQSEQIGQQQEAGMAIEDRVQAAVDQHVTAACAGHAQELEAVRQQLQQTLDRRAQVWPC